MKAKIKLILVCAAISVAPCIVYGDLTNRNRGDRTPTAARTSLPLRIVRITRAPGSRRPQRQEIRPAQGQRHRGAGTGASGQLRERFESGAAPQARITQGPDQGVFAGEKCCRARIIAIRTRTLRATPAIKQRPAAYRADRSVKLKMPGGLSLCMRSGKHGSQDRPSHH